MYKVEIVKRLRALADEIEKDLGIHVEEKSTEFTKPTEEGFYWYHIVNDEFKLGTRWEVVEIRCENVYAAGVKKPESLKDLKGEWILEKLKKPESLKDLKGEWILEKLKRPPSRCTGS